MIRTVSVAAIVVLGATYALAQATGTKAIEERKALMKEINGQARTLSNMVKGSEPFDLAKAKAALKVFEANATKAKGLFPDDSKEGVENRATPAVWANRADFNSKFDAFDKVVKAATTAITDEASFKAEFAKVDGACDACHKDYRARSKR